MLQSTFKWSLWLNKQSPASRHAIKSSHDRLGCIQKVKFCSKIYFIKCLHAFFLAGGRTSYVTTISLKQNLHLIGYWKWRKIYHSSSKYCGLQKYTVLSLIWSYLGKQLHLKVWRSVLPRSKTYDIKTSFDN